ncbi:MAG: PfkB family carbohydrate kinase [Allosphingosinicella sp.]
MTQLLGSGGRAALALSSFRSDLVLHTFQPVDYWEDLEANFRPYGIDCHPAPSSARIEFSYLFPLARPVRSPTLITERPHIAVTGDNILCFGCVEGEVLVKAERAVVDPQGAPTWHFRGDGGQAERLALVLNVSEAKARTGAHEIEAAALALLSDEAAEVVVIKLGPNGAHVFEKGGAAHWVPAYSSAANYTIGSGDIFSAIFAHLWFAGRDPAAAADGASQHVAAYVESAALPLAITLPPRQPRRPSGIQHLVLIVPGASIASKWFADILQKAAADLGIAEVETVALELFLAGNIRPTRNRAVLICALDQASANAILSNRWAREMEATVFIDASIRPQQDAAYGVRIVSDLSQALYDACWMVE